jgi:hypothetical protein
MKSCLYLERSSFGLKSGKCSVGFYPDLKVGVDERSLDPLRDNAVEGPGDPDPPTGGEGSVCPLTRLSS